MHSVPQSLPAAVGRGRQKAGGGWAQKSKYRSSHPLQYQIAIYAQLLMHRL
jgi:hypothetical protein